MVDEGHVEKARKMAERSKRKEGEEVEKNENLQRPRLSHAL